MILRVDFEQILHYKIGYLLGCCCLLSVRVYTCSNVQIVVSVRIWRLHPIWDLLPRCSWINWILLFFSVGIFQLLKIAAVMPSPCYHKALPFMFLFEYIFFVSLTESYVNPHFMCSCHSGFYALWYSSYIRSKWCHFRLDHCCGRLNNHSNGGNNRRSSCRKLIVCKCSLLSFWINYIVCRCANRLWLGPVASNFRWPRSVSSRPLLLVLTTRDQSNIIVVFWLWPWRKLRNFISLLVCFSQRQRIQVLQQCNLNLAIFPTCTSHRFVLAWKDFCLWWSLALLFIKYWK